MKELPSNGGVQFSIRDAIVLFSLVVAATGFIGDYIASYNKILGADEARIAELAVQAHDLQERMQALERDLRACRP